MSSISNTSSSTLPIAFAVGAIAATAVWQLARTKPKPLHVNYFKPKFPWAVHVLAAFPTSMRHKVVLAGAAPKPPMDSVDLGIEESPFVEKKELVKGKLWRVRYQFVRDLDLIGLMKGMFGIDLLDVDAQMARASSPAEKEQLKQLIRKFQALIDVCKGIKDPKVKAKTVFEAGYLETQDMMVVKMANNNLLLYNPCRMHPEILDYLQTEVGGSVEYIVSGSCSHTNQLPQAKAAFPNAKMVCSRVADQKCQSVGMPAADHLYTERDETAWHSQVGQLSDLGVELVPIQGDALTQVLAVVAHGHLLETDLTCYGNGHSHANVPDSLWNNTEDHSISAAAGARLLYNASAAVGTVAPGYLPDFRVMGCDPTSLFSKLLLEEPYEGSCQDMASSLRYLLTKVEFEYADNIHSIHPESTSAEEFKRIVNASWSWLDGKSLLE